MLAVVVPVVDCDLQNFTLRFSNLAKHMANMKVVFIIVIQTHNFLNDLNKNFVRTLKGYGATVVFNNRMNLSAARNMGFREAQKNKSFKRILFLDSDALIVQFEDFNVRKDEILVSQFNFVKPNVFLHSLLGVKNYSLFNIFRCPFIAQFIYNIEDIRVLFDELIGPGEDTIYKSGEDLKFILSNLSYKTVFTNKTTNIIYHPPRGADLNDKRYLYAVGQIDILFFALKSPQIRLKIFSLLFLFLFLCNSIFLLSAKTSHGNLGRHRLLVFYKRMFS